MLHLSEAAMLNADHHLVRARMDLGNYSLLVGHTHLHILVLGRHAFLRARGVMIGVIIF